MTEMQQYGWTVVLRTPAPFQPPVSLFLMEREECARRYAAANNGVILPAYSPKVTPCSDSQSLPLF
jgi:hypothetical protein